MPAIIVSDNSSTVDTESTDGSINDFHTGTENECSQPDSCEPIAVIGFSIKFPQDLETPDSLWEALAEKKSAMTEFPKSRINLDAFYDPDTERINGVSPSTSLTPQNI